MTMTEREIRARIVAGGLCLFSGMAGLLWLILRSIEPATYVAMHDELNTISHYLLITSAIGQTAFVLLWISLPWWLHWVGRALMVKSVALMTYLDFALVVHYVAPFPALELLSVILFSFIVIGIWTQTFTLSWERYKRRNGDFTRTDEEALHGYDHD